jgi:cysteine desulfurase
MADAESSDQITNARVKPWKFRCDKSLFYACSASGIPESIEQWLGLARTGVRASMKGSVRSIVIHMDHNATTKPSAGVVEAMRRALEEHWHNPSSVHRAGQEAKREIELARQHVADLIGAKAREIVFTSGGTEAIDLAVRGVLASHAASRDGDSARTTPTIVTSRVEHSAVRELAEDLEKAGTAGVRWTEVSRLGIVDVSDLSRKIDATTGLVISQWANNETGAIQPIREIARVCRERGVLFLCDATQWVGKMPTSVGEYADEASMCPSDLMAFSPHKFHGPKGVGVLWSRRGVRMRPTLAGTQELGRRGGTENVPGIVGAGLAAVEAMEWLKNAAERDRLAVLRDRFESLVLAGVPEAVINSPTDNAARLWNTTNIGFPKIEAEAMLLLLSERGVSASAGAACSSGSLDPSPVLLAMGVPTEVAHGSLRFSLSKHTTSEEIEQSAQAVIAAARSLGSGVGETIQSRS